MYLVDFNLCLKSLWSHHLYLLNCSPVLWPLTSACFQGNVYVKCPSIPAAMAAVNALHGRYFAGKTSCLVTCVPVLWTNHRTALMSHLLFQVRWSQQHTFPCPHTITCSQNRSLAHSCWPRPPGGDSLSSDGTLDIRARASFISSSPIGRCWVGASEYRLLIELRELWGGGLMKMVPADWFVWYLIVFLMKICFCKKKKKKSWLNFILQSWRAAASLFFSFVNCWDRGLSSTKVTHIQQWLHTEISHSP